MLNREEWKPFIIRFSKELKRKIRIEARKRKITMADLIRKIIEESLK